MSKQKPPKKKVVVTTGKKKTTVRPTISRSKSASSKAKPSITLAFKKENYVLMGLGALLVALGLLLMSGGGMDDPEVWNPNVIYSFRRTVIAPFVILAGLAVEIYAIFK